MLTKLKLTDRNVQSASAPPGKRIDLFDQKVLGLILRVSDSGLKSWSVRYRTLDGTQRRHALGRYPELPLADARERALGVLRDARAGNDPTADLRKRKREAKSQPLKTMRDLKEAYFTACETGEWQPRRKKKRLSTLNEEKGLWRRHVAGTMEDLRVEEVTKDVVRKLLRGLVAKGHGTTSNRVRALIRQVMNFAIAEERIELNPVDKVAAMAQEKPRERKLSDGELRKVWSALSSRKDLSKRGPDDEETRVSISEAMSIAIKLALITLARRSEIAGMRRDELDLENRTWTIPADRTKNGTAHLIPLPSPAVALIRRAIEIAADRQDKSTAFVFPSPRDREKSITPGSISHALRDLRLALGIDDIRPHDLRRTGASLMASERLGIQPFVIGRIINHTTETGGAAAVTLRHYALHDFAGEKRAALEAWSSLLLEVVGDTPARVKVIPIRGAA